MTMLAAVSLAATRAYGTLSRSPHRAPGAACSRHTKYWHAAPAAHAAWHAALSCAAVSVSAASSMGMRFQPSVLVGAEPSLTNSGAHSSDVNAAWGRAGRGIGAWPLAGGAEAKGGRTHGRGAAMVGRLGGVLCGLLCQHRTQRQAGVPPARRLSVFRTVRDTILPLKPDGRGHAWHVTKPASLPWLKVPLRASAEARAATIELGRARQQPKRSRAASKRASEQAACAVSPQCDSEAPQHPPPGPPTPGNTPTWGRGCRRVPRG